MKKTTDNNPDEVVLINDDDQVLGRMDKVSAHQGNGRLHRAVSVFLFDEQGEVLVQQRSEFKIVAANKWANTACGNVRPGETRIQCALRRLREELGIEQVELEDLGKFQYRVSFDNGFSEKEIDAVFAGRWQGSPKPNPKEVRAVRWLDWEQLMRRAQGEQWAPWLIHIFAQKKITKSLTHYSKT